MSNPSSAAWAHTGAAHSWGQDRTAGGDVTHRTDRQRRFLIAPTTSLASIAAADGGDHHGDALNLGYSSCMATKSAVRIP